MPSRLHHTHGIQHMPSMYAVSVGVFTRQLTNLLAQLEKAEAFAAERKFKVDTLAHQRLIWDMAPADLPGAERDRSRQGRRRSPLRP